MRVTPFLSVACACLIVLSAAPRRASALSGDPLLIGAVLSTTGAFAPLGEPEANALKLAETDINAHGGIGGRPITLQILDDEGKPDTAAQLATQLIGSHAVAIIGGTTSATTAAVARVTTAAGVLEVYPTPTALFWDSKNGVVKNIFETTPRNEIEVAALTTFAQKTWHAQKFAILHDENQVGVVGAAILTAEFAKRNLTTSANEAYPTDATDVTAQLGNIKSSGADTIVLWGASPALGIIARQIKQLGLTQHVISSTGILSDNFLKIAGSAADGIYSDSGLNFTHPSPEAAAFLAMYRQAYHVEAVQFASFAWDALEVAALALRGAHGATDGTSLANVLESGVLYKGSTANYRFSPTDHNGIGPDAIHIAVAKNGAWSTL